uniref:Uncharacterized protein n=1 Tax=Tanacetum cinerariifolium TaxID=118510 RepID=A0A6L2P318_TANCI|nr:hypothetical protein [Tanacetum cinerariifolium]
MRWFLGCDSSLDSSRGGEDNEQWWDTVHWREKLFRDDDDQDDNNDDQDTDNDGDDFVHPKLSIHEEEAKDEESFDPIVQTPKNSDDKGNDDASLGMNVGSEEGQDAKDDDEELYRDVNINLDEFVGVISICYKHAQPSPDAGIDSLFESTPRVDVQASTTVALTAPTLPPPTIPTISQDPQAPTPLTTAPSTFLHNLPNLCSLFGFDHRLKTLEANFSEFVQTNQFDGAVSSIPEIVERYIDQRMNEAVKVAVQIQSDRLQDKAQAKNEEFLNKLDENIQKIIKEQVKEHVKVQVFKILPKIEKTMNEQLEAKVLTRSSNSSKTSYVVAADLSEPELKKILIEKMESNKSIHRSNEQMNLYKALMKNPPLDQTEGPRDKEKEKSQSQQALQRKRRPRPLASLLKGPNLIKRLQASLHQKRSQDTLTPELLAGPTYELMKGSCKSLVELKFFLEEVYKATTYQLDWNNPEGQQYPHNLLKPLPLIANSRGRRVIPFDHFINNDLEYLRGGASSGKYTTSVTKTKAADYGHIKWIEDLNHRYHRTLDCQMAELQASGLDLGKLTNLMVKERFAFNVSLRMFTRSIVIQRRMEDLQLGVESYQKKLNLTNPDTYRSDLKRKEAYTAYSNPRGFIYQNKDKQNMLMRIDELYKFSDGTLNDAIWRKSDKERAAGMIQAIDKQLKTRRIMRSLEKFVGGRLYEGDFRMLQRTI